MDRQIIRLEQKIDATKEVLNLQILALKELNEQNNKNESEKQSLAYKVLDSRLALLNELRGNVATKPEIESLKEKITLLELRESKSGGRNEIKDDTWKFIIAIVLIIVSIILSNILTK